MEKSGFFNARKQPDGNYDRTYLAEDFANYFSKFIGNGVYPNPSTGLQVLENDTPDMTVKMQTGYAFINGYAYYNEGAKSFAIDVADGLLNRKDAIFIRWDKVNRQITSVYVKGNPGADPVAPTPVRTADIWDLDPAIINIKAGATKITQADIEDTRMNKDLCGIVTAIIEQIDTTTLYLQVQKDLENFQDVSYEEFNTWFEQMKDQLSTDAAGKLQMEVDEKGVQLYTHSKSGTVHEFTGSGPNGRAKMTADVESGDTFTVNGVPVTAYMGVDDAAGSMAGSSYTDRWVTFVYDSGASTLNFKGGGGKVTVEGLSAGVVKKGATVTVKQGAKTVLSVAGTYVPSMGIVSIPSKSGYVSTNATATLTFSNMGKNFVSVYMDVEVKNWGSKADATGTVIAYIDNAEVDRKSYTRKAGTSAFVRVFAFKANTFFDLSRMKVTVSSTDNNEIIITGKGVHLVE